MRPWASITAALFVFVCLAYLVTQGQADPFDAAIRASVHAWAWPLCTAIMRAITMLGSVYLLVPWAALVVWRWAATGRRRAAVFFAAASLSAEAAAQLLKVLFHRPRPDVFFGLLPAETYSFPSGHAFVPPVMFAMAAVILAEGQKSPAARIAIRWMALPMALAIGFSRVYLGYHYPSDVLAGYALAIVWLAAVRSVWIDKARKPE